MKNADTELRLGAAENAFAQIVWDHAPLSSGDLVKLCREKLEWARSTTYTVLRRLCDKGLFKAENGTVSAVLSREDYLAVRSESFMESTFSGSLPAFIASFTAGKKLNREEAEELRRLIEACTEKEPDPSGKGGRS